MLLIGEGLSFHPETLDWIASIWSSCGCARNFNGYGHLNSSAPPPLPPPGGGQQKQQKTPTTKQTRTKEAKKEMFYLTTHSTHFIYGYMTSDIWLRTILIVRKETRCRHMCYSYAPSHRQDNTYHGLCYTSRGALAGTSISSMGPPHEGSIRPYTKLNS